MIGEMNMNDFSKKTRDAAFKAERALYDVVMEMARVVDRNAEGVLWEMSDYHTRWDEHPLYTWALVKVFTGITETLAGDRARLDASLAAGQAAYHFMQAMHALRGDTEECARDWFAGVSVRAAAVRKAVAEVPDARPRR